MPEGHTVHRIARRFELDVVGEVARVTSPQGRFADGARVLDGRPVVAAHAVGKHLFVGFGPTEGAAQPAPDRWSVASSWLRVHLGLYGAWDFHGRLSPLTPGDVAVGSMGAPRLRRSVRVGEGESTLADDGPFPPDPVGQVRVRVATEQTVADLRGPSACELLTADEVRLLVARAGPDPHLDGSAAARRRFVEAVRARRVAVGQLLMDQSVVSGIGNIYRAELLFRAELDPWTPGRTVPAEVAGTLWDDWAVLLEDGITTGVMLTRADLAEGDRVRALTDPSLRHAVYGRAGRPCLRCAAPVVVEPMAGRKLYRCPACQR
ncbi:Fpg/Nei family DNA glycosylase [Cellulomonas bogoriensis]|uniref:DNA-(apurinic or apyrimidinic site) lyase n=1 Tax=Cellulomonas bogoriensis 69B4 = DSM 16987 TaxID=1386082 RepID=A0A0A0C1Q5_9CELL|nr:DNA glycosylase [Cellulomonas bogoriensis]KGM14110.1 DNA glycosylase [Cellulomonas bogoriensis 69B4 = DSM 16987]